MKRNLTVLTIGLVTFVLVTASAAGLGTGMGSSTLSANNTGVKACGNIAGGVTVSYTFIDVDGVQNIDAVKLTSDVTSGGVSWTDGTGTRVSCVGKSAAITLGGTTKTISSITSGDIGGTYKEVLTLDIANDIPASSISTFSIVIYGPE